MTPVETANFRLACLGHAVTITGRQQQHDPKNVIAVAEQLCQYVASGNITAGSVSGDADKKK